MPDGRKFGGRVKGTPNRVTADVQARLAALKCDPIEGMAQLALDPGNSAELRGRMFAELAQYIAPKRKAVEIGVEPGTRASFVVYGVAEAEDMAACSRLPSFLNRTEHFVEHRLCCELERELIDQRA